MQGRLRAGRRAGGAAALALCVLAAVAGCQGSPSSGGSGSSDPGLAAGAPINLMTIAPEPSSGLDWNVGTEAYIARLNAAGGIDGHKIKFTQCVDGDFTTQNQNETALCAQQAVSNHDLAVIGSDSMYDDVVFPVLKANNIPDIGNFPQTSIDWTDPSSFPMLFTPAVQAAGLADELVKNEGCKTIAFLNSAGAASTKLADDAFAAAGKYDGATVAPAIDVPDTQSDFAPTVAIFNGEGVTCVGYELSLSARDLPAFLAAIKGGGKPIKINFTSTVVPASVLKAIGPSINGTHAIQGARQNAITSNTPTDPTPGEAQMFADFKKYEPSAMNEGGIAFAGWVAMYAFEQVMKKLIADKTPITGASIYKALSGMTIDSGVYPAVDFADPGPIPSEPRIHVTQVNWCVVDNLKYAPSDTQLHDVGAALAKTFTG
jgi:branched-chain amino acid transport system substrate-binding protein